MRADYTDRSRKGYPMRRNLAVLVVSMLAGAGSARANGILIPTEKKLPPLAMLNHHVRIAVEDQVAVTHVEQTFRNHTDRELEVTYVFPVPKGASVRRFSMWVGGKEVPGELVEADKARKIYTDIVQRTLDPGLLEYLGNDLFRMRAFPVPAKSDQKVSLSYTSIAQSDHGLIEYVYPLKTNSKAASTLEKFTIHLDLKSQHPLTNIYSPTHAITISRPSDRHAVVGFEKDQAVLDKDFQLYYSAGSKDVGLTTITHRPITGQNGYFMLLASPRAELSKTQQVPRDMVLVLDTSGSMRGKRMTQARNALKYVLSNLGKDDRFALVNFATTVNKYTDQLLTATSDEVERARRWVDGLEATGGTAINDALETALTFRPASDEGRTFTIVFFTDGRPTIGETNTDKILQNILKRNTTSTRIFTFGVGDDVNASMLDKLAEDSRAISTYVREAEDIEARVSSLFSKIANPVLANLKLTVTPGVSLNEVYPPQLPDLFHGSQLVILGRYTGQGHAAIKLTGNVGMDTREFVYELNFPDKTPDEKTFVEDLWARRKVGYLLDQIRLNGENKELIDEVVTLAKRYGITTPYTSFLIVPDGPVPVARGANPKGVAIPDVSFHLMPGDAPPAALQNGPGQTQTPVLEFIKKTQSSAGEASRSRANFADKELNSVRGDAKDGAAKNGIYLQRVLEARDRWANYNSANDLLGKGRKEEVQAGGLGVYLSCDNSALRCQSQVTQTCTRWIGSRNCLEVGGVWIDEAYEAKMPTVTVKCMSDAYFRILERHPAAKNVFRIGNHLVWVTPSNTALVLDSANGVETMSDADIDKLFVARK